MDNNDTILHLTGTGMFEYDHTDHRNDTCLAVMMVVYVVTTALGLIGNTTSAILIRKWPNLHTVTNKYIFNRFLADSLFQSTSPFWIISITQHSFVFGYPFCVIVSVLMQVGAMASLWFLVLFAEDCYLVYCSRSLQQRTRVLKIGTLVVWFATVLCAVPIGFWTEYKEQSGDAHCYSVPLFAGDWSVSGVIVIFFNVVPILSLWVYILQTSSNECKPGDFEELTPDEGKIRTAPSSRPLLIALSKTVTVFQLPYWISRVLLTIMPTNSISIPYIHFVILCLFQLSFVINPMLFVWYRSETKESSLSRGESVGP